MNADAIAATIAQRRELHPELGAPLRWKGLKRILEREGVALYVMPLPGPAELVPFRGDWAIFINSAEPARLHTRYGAHELGHLWLHHDPTHERGERCYHLDLGPTDDPREHEAELFATMVVAGPPPDPDPIGELRARLARVPSRPIRIQPCTIVAPRPVALTPAPAPVPAAPGWPSADEQHLIACRAASRAHPMFQVGIIFADARARRLCPECAEDHGRLVAQYRVGGFLPHLHCECTGGCSCRWEPE